MASELCPGVCVWADYSVKIPPSEGELNDPLSRYAEESSAAYTSLCEGLTPLCGEWFVSPAALSILQPVAADKIVDGWFNLKSIPEVVFHYHTGRLDAFFTSRDASAKFTVIRSDGRFSMYLHGFCVTKDLAASSCFPASDAVYWRAAIAAATNLDAFCLIAANRSVAAIVKGLSNAGDDYLGGCWDLSWEIGTPVAMAFIKLIVSVHTSPSSTAMSKTLTTFATAKRSRLMITLHSLLRASTTLGPDVFRDSLAGLRQMATETEHMVRSASYYFGADMAPTLRDAVLSLLAGIHTRLDGCRLIANPGAPVPMNANAPHVLPAASSDAFFAFPLHTFDYQASAPRTDLIAFDPPHARHLALNAYVDDWYSVRDKMRAVLTYAQQLFHSRPEHVGNGKRLAFEVISQFVLGALPLPLPRRECRGIRAGSHILPKRCFWFEPHDPRTGLPVTRYDESIRKDLVDILLQLTYILKMCPQATAAEMSKEMAEGVSVAKKATGVQAESSGEHDDGVVNHKVSLSSMAKVVFVSVLAISDAILRVLLPDDLDALRREVDDEESPQSIADMTRVLNGVPWGPSPRNGVSTDVLVPFITPLLATASLNLASPHLLSHVRACHAYFSTVRPNPMLAPLLKGCSGQRVVPMTATSVRDIIGSATSPFFSSFAAKTQSIRPNMFPQIGTSCTAYVILLDNCYAFISCAPTCNFLPSYEVLHVGSERTDPPREWIPRPDALAVLPEGAALNAPPLKTEMDVLHLQQLIDDTSSSVANVERIAAAVVARGVSLRVFLSIICTTPRLLESSRVYNALALLISSSTGLKFSPDNTSFEHDPLAHAGVGRDGPSALHETSQCGLVLEEVLAFPEEIFGLVHRMVLEAVLATSGSSFDSSRSRMLCRVGIIAVQLVECAVHVLETDPVDHSLACPCTFVDGITGAHRRRREALSIQARHTLTLLLQQALPRLEVMIHLRESVAKPTAELYPDALKLATALADFNERHCDLVHLHMAVVTIVGLLVRNQSAQWYAPEVILPMRAEGVPAVTMRSSTEFFWPLPVLVSRLREPILASEPSTPLMGDLIVAGASSAAYLQNIDMRCALEVIATDSTAVDLLCRSLHNMMRLTAMVVRGCQDDCEDRMDALPESEPDSSESDEEDSDGDSESRASDDAADDGVPFPMQFNTRLANEIVASATVLGFILREETGEAVVKVRECHARFIAAGGQWGGDGSTKRRRFLFKPMLDRSTVRRDADVDLFELLRISLNIEVLRPTLPLTAIVRLHGLVSSCLPPSLVEGLLSGIGAGEEGGDTLSCIVPQVASWSHGPAVTTVSTMGRLMIHTSPKVIWAPDETFSIVPKGASSSEAVPDAVRSTVRQLTLGQEGRGFGGGEKIKVKFADEYYISGAFGRARLEGGTEAMGTFVADFHNGSDYFGRQSIVVSAMRRLGDVAYAETIHSSNAMFRSVTSFARMLSDSVYPSDGEKFLRECHAANNTHMKVAERDEAFRRTPLSDLPKHSAVKWPQEAFMAQKDIMGIVRSEDGRSTSIARPIPLWLASCALPPPPSPAASSSPPPSPSIEDGAPAKKGPSMWYEVLLPYAAVRSMVPTAICDAYVWFMVIPESQALHCNPAAEGTAGGPPAPVRIHGYPIPQGTQFARASHALNWLETHLFSEDLQQRDGFKFIRILSDGMAVTVTEECVSVLAVADGSEAESVAADDTAAKLVNEAQKMKEGEAAEKDEGKEDEDVGDAEEEEEEVEQRTVCRTLGTLVSPYCPALGPSTLCLFSQLCRIVPLNEIVAWRRGASTGPSVLEEGRGGLDADAPTIVSIPCANLTFVRGRLIQGATDGGGGGYHYRCDQFPELYIDATCPFNAESVPIVLRPFARGQLPVGMALKGCAHGRYALLLPVVDGLNGYAAVELIQLTPSGDDFIPPTPEAAACLLMCLFRYLPSPMAAIPAVRAAFVNAGHFSPTQEAFLRMFLGDLEENLCYGAAHHLVDEVDACCPNYATTAFSRGKVSAVSYRASDEYYLGYIHTTIRTIKPQLRMDGPHLFERLRQIGAGLEGARGDGGLWEAEELIDAMNLIMGNGLERNRNQHPFGTYATDLEQYWFLQRARATAVDNSWDDLGHPLARQVISTPRDGNLIQFITHSQLSNAQLAGFLKLRVAFTNASLFYPFETLKAVISYSTSREADDCGAALRTLHVESFTHQWTTKETRRVQKEWDDKKRQYRYENERYDQLHERVAYKNRSAVSALGDVLRARAVHPLPSPFVGGYFFYTHPSPFTAVHMQTVPKVRFTHFVGDFSPALGATGRVTVTLPLSSRDAVDPFGGFIGGLVAAFPLAHQGISTFSDGLPYAIDECDEVSRKAVAKQRQGLAAFGAAMDQSVAHVCHRGRHEAIVAFERLQGAIMTKRNAMLTDANGSRISLLQAEFNRVCRGNNFAQELNGLHQDDPWVTMGAILRSVLSAERPPVGCTRSDLLFRHLFTSHAAMVLSDLLLVTEELLDRFKAVPPERYNGMLLPSEVDAADAVLRQASSKRVYVEGPNPQGVVTFDPVCLYFEWCDRKILRDTQYGLLVKIQRALREEASPAEVHQLLMGEGKSSVIIPILALQLCQPGKLLIVSCPNQLVKAAERNLLTTMLGPLARDVMTLNVSREKDLTPSDLAAMKAMEARGGVVLAAPNTLKCIFSLNPLDIANDPKRDQSYLGVYAKAIKLLRDAPLILDEVDDTCDPMRSSLIFPCGVKERLHESTLRWRLPTLILHILHACSGIIALKRANGGLKSVITLKALADLLPIEVRGNAALVPDVQRLVASIESALSTNNVTLDPHLLLTTEDAFQVYLLEPLKPIVATLLSLPLIGSANIPRDTMVQLLSETRPPLTAFTFARLSEPSRCAVNLAVEWLHSLLPHVLRKQHRVQYGVVGLSDMAYLRDRALEAGQDPSVQLSRTILAVPFDGKDQPSLSSEFSHPDVVVGLSITAHILSPLARDRDAGSLIRRLKVELSEDSAPMEHREAYKRFNGFMREGLWRILSGKGLYAADLYARLVAKYFKGYGGGKGPRRGANRQQQQRGGGGAFVPMLTIPKDTMLLIMHDLGALDRVADSAQSAADVYEVLRNSISAACFFCVNISSEHLRLNPYTFTACGGDLLSTVTFTKRIGFSGTASDMIPHEVPKGCQDQAESEGKASSVLLCSEMSALYLPGREDAADGGLVAAGGAAAGDSNGGVATIEDEVAKALLGGSLEDGGDGGFNAIIDVGAMLTQSNEGVARWLLSILPKDRIKGCVFFRRDDTKVVLLRDSDRVVPLEVGGLRREEQFVFYDQVHTRGQDVKHHPTARALVLLGMKGDLDLNALAQGVFRMRGLGSGQRLTLFVPHEAQAAIRRMCASGVIKNTPPTAPITNALVHAWALCNLIRQTRIARVALKYENTRRLLVKPFIAACSFHNGVPYSAQLAATFRDPVGFRLSNVFVPIRPSLHDSCVELKGRFEKWKVDYAEAKAYIDDMRAAAVAVVGTDARELDALMEKDQQEYKVKEKEVDKVVNVQDDFSREGEAYVLWSPQDAVGALFAAGGGAHRTNAEGGEDNSGAREDGEVEGAVEVDNEAGEDEAEAEEEKYFEDEEFYEQDEEEEEDRALEFPFAPSYMLSSADTGEDTLRLRTDCDAATTGALQAMAESCQLRFSPNFYPYADGAHHKEGRRRVRPINFILEICEMAGRPSRLCCDAARLAMNGDDSVVALPQSALRAVQHVTTMAADGAAASKAKQANAEGLIIYGTLKPPPPCEQPEALSPLVLRRCFVVVTLAEAVGMRRLIEASNRTGHALVEGYAFALRDYNHGLAPAYREDHFTDSVGDAAFHSVHAALNFADGSPLFAVLGLRARVESCPSVSASLTLLTGAAPLLKESSAAYFALKWLSRYTVASRGRCFDRLSRDLRRPDAAKMDWRYHCGARLVVDYAVCADEALVGRALAVELLFCARARAWSLGELQRRLDPEHRSVIAPESLLALLSREGGEGLGMRWVTPRDVDLLCKLLDYDVDGIVGYDDLARCVEAFDDEFPDCVVN